MLQSQLSRVLTKLFTRQHLDRRLRIALSGGRDSIALLHGLWQVRAQFNLELSAHLVRHGLRDDGSDEVLCRDVCDARSIPLTITRLPPGSVEATQGEGTQDQARTQRYAALLAAAAANNEALVTAHHGDDAIETMMIRWSRGAGLEGLAGIRPIQVWDGVTVVRPLLEVTRSEIDIFIDAEGLAFEEDPSNAEDDYLRNQIRHHVVPAWRAVFPPGTDAAMRRSTRLLRQDADALIAWAEDFVMQQGHITKEPAWYGPRQRLIALGDAVLAQVIRHAARHVADHIPTAQAVYKGIESIKTGRRLWSDGHVKIGRAGHFVVVRALMTQPLASPLATQIERNHKRHQCIRWSPAVTLDVVWHDRIDQEALLWMADEQEAWIALEALGDGLQVRSLRVDERWLRHGGSSKGEGIESRLRALGVPRALHSTVAVVADERGAVWIPGMARGERGLVRSGGGAVVQMRLRSHPWYATQREKAHAKG